MQFPLIKTVQRHVPAHRHCASTTKAALASVVMKINWKVLWSAATLPSLTSQRFTCISSASTLAQRDLMKGGKWRGTGGPHIVSPKWMTKQTLRCDGAEYQDQGFSSTRRFLRACSAATGCGVLSSPRLILHLLYYNILTTTKILIFFVIQFYLQSVPVK
jgi:hypothetical protein